MVDVAVILGNLRMAADILGKANKLPEQKQILDSFADIALLQQEKFNLAEEIRKLKKDNEQLREIKKFKLAKGCNYRIDPEYPDRPLCPLCTPKNKTEVPLRPYLKSFYCQHCKGVY